MDAAIAVTHPRLGDLLHPLLQVDDAHYAREMTFMTSLCEHDQVDWIGRLSMWQAYGGARDGSALVFKPEVLTDPSLNLSLYLSPVRYGAGAYQYWRR